MILHGYSRTTGDLDVWVERSVDNYQQLTKAFLAFGMPTFDMSAYNFLKNSAMYIFTFGRQPVAIDIITQLKGLDFTDVFAAASIIEVDGLPVRLIPVSAFAGSQRSGWPPS